MNAYTNESTDIGKQKGSQRLQRLRLLSLLLVFSGVMPITTFAATSAYLAKNAPTFIENIRAEYGEMVNIAAMLQDYDEKLILAVIVIESEGKVAARSHVGAQGLMQLMPATAKSLGVTDSHDPFQNILAGTRYLKELEDRYGFDNPQEALVAYNMGPSRAKRWLSQYGPEDYLYVQKVMYVHSILVEEERNNRILAQATKEKMATATDTVSQLGLKPILTKPRSIAMAAFPMVISDNRRSEVEEK